MWILLNWLDSHRPFCVLGFISAVNRWGGHVAEFLSPMGSLRKIWKLSTPEKTIFFLSFYLQWQRPLSIFRSEGLRRSSHLCISTTGWDITLLFWGRRFALGTDLEINTFHFRFPPKDLKVFWSVNTQIPFESYRMKLEYLCLLKEMTHSLITLITDANNVLAASVCPVASQTCRAPAMKTPFS